MRAERTALALALALSPGAWAGGSPPNDPIAGPTGELGDAPLAEPPGPERAPAHGRPVDRQPVLADVASSTAGTAGHAGAGTAGHAGAGTAAHAGAGTPAHAGAGTAAHAVAGTAGHAGAGTAAHVWAGAGTSAAARAVAPPPAAHTAAAAPRVQDVLARQLDDEAAAVDRALAAVADKRSAAELTRDHRLRAAVRAVRAAPGEDAMAVARRRAGARLLLERDGGERALLVDEDARLRAARAGIAGATALLPSIALPREIARPAPGAIARHFGTLEHERSKATLTRRGIDIEVDDHSPVTAPAAGTVRYAGPIRGLEQGVILDHGAYLTVVAKLAEIALPVGAPVAAGDRIGRAARHRVYFELRIKLGPGGMPIDPEPLIHP